MVFHTTSIFSIILFSFHLRHFTNANVHPWILAATLEENKEQRESEITIVLKFKINNSCSIQKLLHVYPSADCFLCVLSFHPLWTPVYTFRYMWAHQTGLHIMRKVNTRVSSFCFYSSTFLLGYLRFFFIARGVQRSLFLVGGEVDVCVPTT